MVKLGVPKRSFVEHLKTRDQIRSQGGLYMGLFKGEKEPSFLELTLDRLEVSEEKGESYFWVQWAQVLQGEYPSPQVMINAISARGWELKHFNAFGYYGNNILSKWDLVFERAKNYKK